MEKEFNVWVDKYLIENIDDEEPNWEAIHNTQHTGDFIKAKLTIEEEKEEPSVLDEPWFLLEDEVKELKEPKMNDSMELIRKCPKCQSEDTKTEVHLSSAESICQSCGFSGDTVYFTSYQYKEPEKEVMVTKEKFLTVLEVVDNRMRRHNKDFPDAIIKELGL